MTTHPPHGPTARSLQSLAALALLTAASAAAHAFDADVDGLPIGRFELNPAVTAPAGVVTVDFVLDATNYQGEFLAWQLFQARFDITSPDVTLSPSILVQTEEDPFATAPVDTDGDGADDLFPTGGNEWTFGRRPGAFIFSGGENGGNRFGNQSFGRLEPITSGFRMSSVFDSDFFSSDIGGLQQPESAPIFNPNLHKGREYAAFRFQLELPTTQAGELTVSLADIPFQLPSFAVYTGNPSTFSEFLVNGRIHPLTIVLIPTPSTLIALGASALLTARRRR
ncbi:MAG: hypothetical protein AAF297_08415 [Planctomycetota bacterium]